MRFFKENQTRFDLGIVLVHVHEKLDLYSVQNGAPTYTHILETVSC